METLVIGFMGALFGGLVTFLFNLYIQYCITRKQEYCELKKTIFMFDIWFKFLKNIDKEFNKNYNSSKANFVVPHKLQSILNAENIPYDWINYQEFLHTFDIIMPKESSLLFLATKEYDKDILKSIFCCIAASSQLMSFILYRNNDFQKIKSVINNFINYKNINIDYDRDIFYSGKGLTEKMLEEIKKQKNQFPECVKKIHETLKKRHWFYFWFHSCKFTGASRQQLS